MRNLTHVAVLLVAFGLAGSAGAEEGKRRGPEGAHPHPHSQKPGSKNERKRGGKDGFVEMLKRLDVNEDSKVSFEEFAAGERVSRLSEDYQRRLFKRIDKNSDGAITQDDLPKGEPPSRSHRDIDKNGDGEVSFEEFQKSGRMGGKPEKLQRQVFDKMDRNGDGVLNEADRREWEGRRPGGPPKHHAPVKDLDNDGKISFEEFRKHPRHAKQTEDEQEDQFEALDKNSDGFIDESERPKGQDPGGRPHRGGGRGDKKPGPPKAGERDA